MFSINNQQNQKLIAICQRLAVSNLFLFGSAVSAKFLPSSDLDFAVTFSDSLSPLEHGEAFFELKYELENLFDHEIDLISYRVISNPIFKKELDLSKIELYAA